jgi:radical SAM protein with 4Fe4S-binding SPASM domain
VEKVLDGIDAVNAAKHRLQRKKPVVTVNCVVTRDSLHELPALLERLGSKGVARVTLLHLIAYAADQVEQSVIPLQAEAAPVFAQAQAIARQHRIELVMPPAPGERSKCRQPFRALFINWDGDVRPCCMSTFNERGALLVGNVAQTPLPELWNNGYMHRLRRALDREENLPGMCGPCPMRRCDLESHTHPVFPPEPAATRQTSSLE